MQIKITQATLLIKYCIKTFVRLLFICPPFSFYEKGDRVQYPKHYPTAYLVNIPHWSYRVCPLIIQAIALLLLQNRQYNYCSSGKFTCRVLSELGGRKMPWPLAKRGINNKGVYI